MPEVWAGFWIAPRCELVMADPGTSRNAEDLFNAISVLLRATPMPTCSDLNLEGWLQCQPL